MKTEPGSAPAPLVDPALALHGGVDVPVTLFTGEQTTVKVRLLPLDESLRTFLALLTDNHALADYVTGSPAGWSKTIQPWCVLAIAESAIDLNFVWACRWADLQAKFVQLAGELKRPPVRKENRPAPASASSASTPAS